MCFSLGSIVFLIAGAHGMTWCTCSQQKSHLSIKLFISLEGAPSGDYISCPMRKEQKTQWIKTGISLSQLTKEAAVNKIQSMPKPRWSFSSYIARLIEIDLEKDVLNEHRDVEVALSPQSKEKRNTNKGAATEGAA
jgi:hypothetical protein